MEDRVGIHDPHKIDDKLENFLSNFGSYFSLFASFCPFTKKLTYFLNFNFILSTLTKKLK